jgi:membrane-associated phospholipid phosphatase
MSTATSPAPMQTKLPTTKADFTKAIVILLFATTWWQTYNALNTWNASPHRAIYLSPSPCDIWPGIIQPASALIYVGFTAVLLIWPLILSWETKAFCRLMAMITIGSLIGFITFAAWPLNMRRPEFTGNSFGESIMRAVFAIDHSANCFPSFHTFFALLGALVIKNRSKSFFQSALAFFLASAVMISTITTGQHYFIDLIGGTGLALINYIAGGHFLISPSTT